MMQLDYRDARPIYTQIGDNIREQIRRGILEPGDRLPSVRELAARLAINPNTIQRAYRELEAIGWIATVPGKGCFVCHREPPVPEDPFGAFDLAVRALEAQGITRAELIRRLEGGDTHA